jgi:hypothetical protein
MQTKMPGNRTHCAVGVATGRQRDKSKAAGTEDGNGEEGGCLLRGDLSVARLVNAWRRSDDI